MACMSLQSSFFYEISLLVFLLGRLAQSSLSLDSIHSKRSTSSKPATKAQSQFDQESKIIGGRIVVKKSEYPFAVHIYTMLLDQQAAVECGGSIMSHTRILTACHCLASIQQDLPARMYDSGACIVSAGSTQKQDTRLGQLRKAQSFAVHPLCSRTPWGLLSHDLGIITLSDTNGFKYSPYVQPLNIPSRHEKDFMLFMKKLKRSHANCSVIGWGVHSMTINESSPMRPINYSGTSKWLRATEMYLITDKECEITFCELSRQVKTMNDMCRYKSRILRHICSYGVKENETDCQGDSGGPLICLGYVVGVVSSGFECGLDFPSVYAGLVSSLKWLGLTRSIKTKVGGNVEKLMEPPPAELEIGLRAEGTVPFFDSRIAVRWVFLCIALIKLTA